MNNIENQLDLVSDMFVAFKATLATTAALPGGPAFSAGVFTASGNAALNIDSASAASGDVILVKNEIRPERNGLYVVNNPGAAGAKFILSRLQTQDSATEVLAAETVSVVKGTANGDSLWRVSSDGVLTPNVTPIQFQRVTPQTPSILSARLATAAALPANGRVGNVLTANANGALTIDEVSAEVGDLVLVKNEGVQKHNGLFTVVAAGGASAKFILERSEGFRDSQDVVSGSMVTVAEGRRNAVRQFVLTQPAPIVLNSTVLTFLPSTPKDFGLVSSLPTTEALVGDRCTFKADSANGILWSLLYDGEGEFPWKKIGGPPMRHALEASVTTESTSYVDLTGGPTLTTPLAGEYRITTAAMTFNQTAATGETFMAPNVAGSVHEEGYVRVNNGSPTTVNKTAVKAAAKGAVIKSQYKVGSGKGFYQWRSQEIDPIRVG